MTDKAAQVVSYPGFNGVTIVADVFGRNICRPVLFAHGGGQTRHAWRQTGKRLADAGFQSICMDLRGHGESDWCPEGDYRLEAFSEDLACVCEQLESPPVLIGASLGGLSAMVAAGELHPGLFSAIILVDITPHMEMSGVEKIVGFMSEHLVEGFASLDQAAKAISEYLPHRPKPKNLDGLAKNLKLGDDGRYRWHWDPQFVSGINRPSASRDSQRLAAAVANIEVPLMLVRGRASELVSEESVRQFLELKPDAKYVDVADAGHMVAGDSNDVFTDAITNFIRAV